MPTHAANHRIKQRPLRSMLRPMIHKWHHICWSRQIGLIAMEVPNRPRNGPTRNHATRIGPHVRPTEVTDRQLACGHRSTGSRPNSPRWGRHPHPGTTQATRGARKGGRGAATGVDSGRPRDASSACYPHSGGRGGVFAKQHPSLLGGNGAGGDARPAEITDKGRRVGAATVASDSNVPVVERDLKRTVGGSNREVETRDRRERATRWARPRTGVECERSADDAGRGRWAVRVR